MSAFDESFDLVVVGSGGGSMCAGLVARQAGKSVLIVFGDKDTDTPPATAMDTELGCCSVSL